MLVPPGYRDAVLVGKGATSRVYRAVSAKTGQPVALKRMYRQLLRTEDALSRLRREFEALSRLRHENIVRTYDVIRWDGDPTVVMDYVDGVGLEERIAAGDLDFDEIQRIAESLLDALIAAHGAGIVHRDVKPQNVRLGVDGRVYLLDFGSARFDAASELTQTGTTVGTPDYMAPELFAGSVYDPRVDVYGVGATLYECIAGVVPQSADSLTQLAFKRTHEDVPPIHERVPDVPEPLAQLVDRSLLRRPDDRFSSAALARWTLDHPDLALAFARRRASHPPCLHCDERIDPGSATCPACGSSHPFAYEPGSSHVLLKSVRHPAALSGLLRARFPERRTKGHDRALAERVAALEEAPQRLLSFVDRDEARRFADELEAVGAQCEVIDDQGTSGWRLYGWCIVAFVVGILVVGATVLEANIGLHHALMLVAPTIAALLGERVFAVVRSLGGVLTESRYPAPITEGARAKYGAAALVSGGAAVAVPAVEAALAGAGAPAALVAALPHAQFPLLVAATVAGVLTLGSWAMSLRRSPKTKSGSAEPSTVAKLRRAFALPPAFSQRLKPEVAVVLAATGLALVPVELMSLDAVRAATVSALAPPVATTIAPGPIVDVPGAPIVDPGFSELPALPEPPSVAPDPVAPVPAPPANQPSPVPYGAAGAIFLLGAFLAWRMDRRVQRIRSDGKRIFEGFERPELGPGVAPARREAKIPTSIADRIAMSTVPDGFLLAARARAADLARCLPDGASERLERALDALGERIDTADLEASYLLRSIRESDPEHRLRFELLALEGRMEADAAEAWYARATKDDTNDDG